MSSLPSGSWFARVRGIDANGLEGLDAVKLIAVKDGQWRVTDSTITLANGKAILGWTGQLAGGQSVSGQGVSAVLASDAALSKDVRVIENLNAPGAAQPGVVLGDLEPGIYYLRLQSSHGTQKGLASKIYRFELSGNWGQIVFTQASALQAVR